MNETRNAGARGHGINRSHGVSLIRNTDLLVTFSLRKNIVEAGEHSSCGFVEAARDLQAVVVGGDKQLYKDGQSIRRQVPL